MWDFLGIVKSSVPGQMSSLVRNTCANSWTAIVKDGGQDKNLDLAGICHVAR